MEIHGDPKQSSGGLDGFPTELKVAILKLSTDFGSLQALVHASPSFFHAYTGLRRSILSTVVIREIHPDVILDALAVLDCPGASVQGQGNEDFVVYRSSPSSSEVLAFLAKYEANTLDEPPSSLPLHTLIRLICFHKKVIRYFAEAFTSSILAVHPMSKDSTPDPSPLSSIETRRIHRALYRFELYFRLFKGSQWEVTEWLGYPAPTNRFLNIYSPWEVEELHCVHDFLYRRFLVAYVDVAQHDVRMGKSGLHSGPLLDDYLGDYNSHIEHYLSLGLTYIYDSVTIPGFVNRTIEMAPVSSSYKHLPKAVKASYSSRRAGSIAEDDRDAGFRGDKFANEPNEAWVWWKRYILHPSISVTVYPRMLLRKWGYCMWDSDRLREWDVLREEYDEDYFNNKFFSHAFTESTGKFNEAVRTEALRAEVWLKGGSGYWTEDESKIVWSGAPRQDSLADAVARKKRYA